MTQEYKEVGSLSFKRELGSILLAKGSLGLDVISFRVFAKNTLDHYSDKPIYGSIENCDKHIIDFLKENKHRVKDLDMRKSVSFVIHLNSVISPVSIYNV